MASVGHIVVGMAAARAYDTRRAPRWTGMAAWSALAMLPDLDVIGFALGVRYGDPWGHRGAAHSLVMAAALGVAVTAIARRRGLPLGRTALFTVTVLASHGLLDTMTDGGLGCALLWPFSLTRYFAPWRPIPVAPIGLDFLSAVRRDRVGDRARALRPAVRVRAAAATPDAAAADRGVVDGDVAGVGLADRVRRSDSRFHPRHSPFGRTRRTPAASRTSRSDP